MQKNPPLLFGLSSLRRIVTCVTISIALPVAAVAQDGWLFSATPPIVVRWDGSEVAFNFTNTSDTPIHGVTLRTEKDGQKQSRVIIDTIEPHETVSVDATILADVVSGATITCSKYSKPLKIPFP
jgi:hypothetical protein